ncbi:perlucin-like protein isoform X2 [Ostrea edulis]|uniref:perlucin-like protein isoform X2 n=1 Tax=Ostrea edulis TaxID=37623 RepID=UPI0024AEDFAB|nr:perlucin-like protein isoform X2 [Ostrea edulis]
MLIHAVEDTMNSNISRLVLCFALVGLVNLQLLYDGHSENQECEVMEMLRKALSDGENLQKQVTQLNKEIQVLKRRMHGENLQTQVTELNKEIQELKRRMGCPKNWVLYNNSCYKLFLSKESWSDAQVRCSSYGAVLAEITTAEENAFIVNTMLHNASTISVGVWAGGTDARKEGEWIWWSTNTTMSFINWRDNQPDNWYTTGEHCLELSKGFEWKWNDYQCHIEIEFLCETEANY